MNPEFTHPERGAVNDRVGAAEAVLVVADRIGHDLDPREEGPAALAAGSPPWSRRP